MTQHLRLKKWLLRTGIAIVCIVLLILGAASVHALIAHQKMKSVCAQMREELIPLTWEEYYQLFPSCEASLAAQPQFFTALDRLYDVTRQSWKENGDGSGEIHPPRLDYKATSAKLDRLEDHLQTVAPALDDFCKAVEAEPFWLIPPPKNSFDSPSTNGFIKLRTAARLFHSAAILHAERNEPLVAAQAVIDGIRFAEVPHRGSFTIDEMCRFACEGIALQSLEYVLAKTDPPQKSLHDLKKILATHSDMRSGILGEIVLRKQWHDYISGLSLEEIKKGIEQCDSPAWELAIWYLQIYTDFSQMNAAYELEFLHHTATNWALNWQDFANQNNQAHDSIPLPYRLSVYGKDLYHSLKHLELEKAGARNCGRIAVAIEMYSQEHGALPATLAELVPEYLGEIPSEPFYGKQLTYETDDNAGTLSFFYPRSVEAEWKKGDTYTFKVFANRESIKLKEKKTTACN